METSVTSHVEADARPSGEGTVFMMTCRCKARALVFAHERVIRTVAKALRQRPLPASSARR
jgi:hypothetical protein